MLVMNVVNFSDGVDGLAAGVCAISAVAFSVIAFDLDRGHAGVLAAITAGAALGFLVHNLPPGARLHGRLRAPTCSACCSAAIAVEGAVKTQAVLALLFPLVVLAVPVPGHDVRRAQADEVPAGPSTAADANHFHHRFSRIGFSQRRTVVYLYAWTVCLAGFAAGAALRALLRRQGDLDLGWSLVMGALGLLVLAASVYLVYVLEILKFRRLDAMRVRRTRPDATERRSTPTSASAWRRGSSRR